jgi:hypothetical protein
MFKPTPHNISPSEQALSAIAAAHHNDKPAKHGTIKPKSGRQQQGGKHPQTKCPSLQQLIHTGHQYAKSESAMLADHVMKVHYFRNYGTT